MPTSPGQQQQPPPQQSMYGGSSPSHGMGPPHHHPMGPPLPSGHHHYPAGMGPPPMSNMIPPSLSNNHHEIPPMPPPPPSSVTNQHPLSMHPMHNECSMDSMHENASSLTTTASGNMTNVSQINCGGIITSVITTGPDGTPVDEASQQSTLSNASAASGDDPSSTPKRKEQGMNMMGPMGAYLSGASGTGSGHGHPHSQMTPCSPGINSIHDDYPGADASPPWSRTPSSPVFNSHINQDIYRPKKHDSLSKLYEMDDSQDRRLWLDKLLQFMDDRGTPISACPTISKNPLDLFRLYLYVKERGGFMEVCKVTKNKIWKDIAGLLGIGASSSAAYTLRKHYTKNLLPYECHFDRGGIDPQPIINQIESTTKKKSTKAAPVPSPVGSSNSQDSFSSVPGPAAMDGYGYGYPPEYAQRGPPPSMHGNQNLPPQGSPYPGQPGYSQYPPDQYGQQYMGPNAYLSPSSRPMYHIYPPDSDRNYGQGNSGGPIAPGGSQPPPQQQQQQQQQQQSMQPSPAGVAPGGQDPYSRSPYGGHQTIYHPRPTFSGSAGPPPPSQQIAPPSASQTVPTSQVVAPPSPTPVVSQSSSQNYPPSSPQQQAPSPAPTQQQSQSNHIPPPQSQIPPPQQQQSSSVSQPPHSPASQQPSTQPPQQHPPPSPSQSMTSATPPPQQPSHHEYYRPDQVYPSNQNQVPPVSAAGGLPYPPNKGMPPPPGSQPRRHPDFSKEQQPPYPSYNNQQRPVYGGWPNNSNNNSNNNQYRGGYPPGPTGMTPSPSQQQQWNQNSIPRPPPPPPPVTNSQPPPATSQWDQHRYPQNSSQSFPQTQQQSLNNNQWSMSPAATNSLNQSASRTPRPSFRPDGKPFPPVAPSPPVKGPPSIVVPPVVQPPQQIQQQQPQPQQQQQQIIQQQLQHAQQQQQQPQQLPPSAVVMVKRELVFPPDSVEATTPLIYKRKKLTRADVAPVDAWKLMMSLRSGLLAETSYALDVLNALLYDDVAVQYFGLSHMPGLLDVLLEHFKHSLEDVFEEKDDDDNNVVSPPQQQSCCDKNNWYETIRPVPVEPDLGRIIEPPDASDRLPLIKAQLPDYTLKSRRGVSVGIVDGSGDLFVSDDERSWSKRNIDFDDLIEPDTSYIVPCFRSEFGVVPIVKLLSAPRVKKNDNNEQLNNDVDNCDNNNDNNNNTSNNGHDDICDNDRVVAVADNNYDDNSSNNNNNSERGKDNADKCDDRTSFNNDNDNNSDDKIIECDENTTDINMDDCEQEEQHCFQQQDENNDEEDNKMDVDEETTTMDGLTTVVNGDITIGQQEPDTIRQEPPDTIRQEPPDTIKQEPDTTIRQEPKKDDENDVMMKDKIRIKEEVCSSHEEELDIESYRGRAVSNGRSGGGGVTSINNSITTVVKMEVVDSNPDEDNLRIMVNNNRPSSSSSSGDSNDDSEDSNCSVQSSRVNGLTDKPDHDDHDDGDDADDADDVIVSRKNCLTICADGSIKSTLSSMDAVVNDDEDNLEARLGKMKCRVQDSVGVLKKRRLDQFEDESYSRDEASLCLVSDTQDTLARRCVTLSSILRNLTFVPGNEFEFAKNSNFLILMGKLLLLHHEHPLRTQKQQNYDREEDSDFTDCCSSLYGESEWWWDFLHHVRESVLVSITNISGCIDLSVFSEEVSRPIVDGLLHWAVCSAAQGQDSFPGYTLSPQRLALEALCKLCVNHSNVDLVMATPPYTRLEKLTCVLTRLLCNKSGDQVLREFAVNLLHYLAAADSSMSRIIALQSPCISLLLSFIEQADQSALGVVSSHGINTLRDNPELMGTSLDMLRRAARTLLHLSKHPDNRSLFLQQEQRLLALAMSQVLDQQVAAVISQVLYQCSRSPSPPSSYYYNCGS